MPDVNDLHRFYESNLPEYKRMDLISVTKSFLKLMGKSAKKPFKAALNNFQDFKRFVAVEWQGAEISTERLPVEHVAAPENEHGACHCGGRMVKRRNAKKGNYFLGCSNYPRCKNTENL